MVKAVNVIVTCTKRKSQPIPKQLMLRNVSGATVASRVRHWVKRLGEVPSNSVSVRDLYAGDHWSIARDLAALSNAQRQLRIWVVSAGYGLIKLDDVVKPYSATFSRKHSDSVISKSYRTKTEVNSACWWNELINALPKMSEPRSLAELVNLYPQDCLLIVASETYLRAIKNDLENAANQFNDPQRFSILSAGTRSLGSLTDQLVPCNARLQKIVGGVRRSLNIRLAQKVLKETSQIVPTLPVLRERLQKLLNDAPELEKYNRQPLSDEAVRQYIRMAMKMNPAVRHTPLLRQLRAAGNACEQSRFRSLFQEIEGSFHGQE